jgi:uncharacterized membrane protein
MSYTISNPYFIITVLLAVELGLIWISGSKRYEFMFQFLPAVFWIYFLPMVLSTLKIVDRSSPVYSQITAQVLPAALFMLLLAVDLGAIVRLGKQAIGMFFVGSFGIVVGMITSFSLFRPWIGGEYWSGFAALSGSWTGGSANLVAVKEAFQTPQVVFAPIVIVDTIVPYVWMAILLSMVRFQDRFDRWNGCDRTILERFRKREIDLLIENKTDLFGWIPDILRRPVVVMVLLAAAYGVAQFSHFIAKLIPPVKGFSSLTWEIVISSSLGLICSFVRVRAFDRLSQKWGYVLLYLVLASIGAQADLSQFGSMYLLIIAGFMVVLIHAGCLYIATRIFKLPLFLAVTASQANIGGVASAPVVAESYLPGFASIGLLLAILGNIIGTYVGILTGTILQVIKDIGYRY